MNLRKTGIKLILLTILLSILAKQAAIGGQLALALTVFGIGAGVVLIVVGDFSKMD